LVFITDTQCVYCAVRSTLYVLPTQCVYVFCVDLRTNSDYFTVQHWLVGFYNRDAVCLLRGTDWINPDVQFQLITNDDPKLTQCKNKRSEAYNKLIYEPYLTDNTLREHYNHHCWEHQTNRTPAVSNAEAGYTHNHRFALKYGSLLQACYICLGFDLSHYFRWQCNRPFNLYGGTACTTNPVSTVTNVCQI
jgi:hypothetical protein